MQACLLTVRAMRQGGLANEEEEEEERGSCSIFAALVASCQIASGGGRFSSCFQEAFGVSRRALLLGQCRVSFSWAWMECVVVCV